MGQLVRDVHTSAMRLIESQEELTPVNNKYKRISIPNIGERHCLGYLEGPAADLEEDTRNGRGYVLRLWQNIENSEDFKEGMQCATIIGELDHPEERVDYSLTKGAVVLTDWEIREDEGILWCRFAILDNDEGRTLLSYVKFGTILGVSSRGLGEEIIQNGRNIIDPDTYEFYCFDVVAFPAAACARQTYKEPEIKAESIHKAFSDRVLTEATKLNTAEDLNKLKEVVESTNVANKATLVEAISNKLSSLSESTDDQRNACDEDAKSDEDGEKQVLLSSIAAKDNQIAKNEAEISKLQELLKKTSEDAAYFRKAFQGQRSEKEQAENAVDDSLQSMNEMSRDYETLKSEYTEECGKLIESLNFRKRAYDKIKARNAALEAERNRLANEVNNLTESLKSSKRKLSLEANRADQLMEYNKSLSHKLNALKEAKQTALKESRTREVNSNKLIESYKTEIQNKEGTSKMLEESLQTMESRLHEVKASAKKQESRIASLLEKYLESRCSAYNLDIDAVKSALPNKYTESDIDKTVKQLSDRQQRYNAMPIDIPAMSARVVEHKNPMAANSSSPTFVLEALRRGGGI